MRRSLSPACLAACALLAIAVVLGRQPWSESQKSGRVFEVTVSSPKPGLVQLYYDLGSDFNESDSSSIPIQANTRTTLRFDLPYGRISKLRLDPLNSVCRVTVEGARILNAGGGVLRDFQPADFAPRDDIASIEPAGAAVVITSTPRGNDPSVNLRLDAPLEFHRVSASLQVLAVFAVCVAVVLLVSFACRSPGPGLLESSIRVWSLACRSPGWSAAFVALLSTVLANYPVIFSGKSFVSPGLGVPVLYGDSPWLPGAPPIESVNPNGSDVGAVLWHHLPLSILEHKSLFEDGELPLWNRYDSAGVALLGQGQSCMGDPLHMLPVLANGAAWAWDLKYLLSKWLFALGIGLCAWRLFRHLPSALVLTASSSFIGFFIYRINHPAIFSMGYAPWILYCWIRFVDSASARSVVLWLAGLIAANWCEMTSGTAKEAYVLLFSMNLAGLVLLLVSRRPPRERLWLACGAAAAGLLFLMIGAPVWYTFYRELAISYTSYNSPQAFQIQPGMLAGLFDEAFYRPFQDGSTVSNPSVNFLILTGLIWALLQFRELVADRRSLALLLASIPAFAIAFGVVPPGVLTGIPFLGNIIHVDNAFSCSLVVILSVLSGFGLRDAFQRLGKDGGGREAATVLSVVVGLLAVYFGTAQSVLRSAYWIHTWGKVITVDPFIYAYALAVVAGVGLVLFSGRSVLRGGAGASAVVILALGTCLIHWRLGLKTGPEYPGYVARLPGRLELGAVSPAMGFISADKAAPSRAIGYHNDLLPGWNIVYGVEGISGPDALSNPRYRELLDTSGLTRVWDWRYITETTDTAPLKPILNALGVRYYVGFDVDPISPDKNLVHVASKDMEVFESPSAWPRAFFTNGIAVYSDAKEYHSRLMASDGRPFAGIEQGDWDGIADKPVKEPNMSRRSVSPAAEYKLTSNTTSFSVNATGPGVIVLTEAYEPDNFRAWLNGKRVPYVRVNHAFKGIIVGEAGLYDVRFAYWPRGFSASLEFCYAGLLLLGVLVCGALFGVPRTERL